MAPHVRWRTGGRLSQRALAPVGSIPGDEKLRAAHREQMAAVADLIDADVLETIKLMGLGRVALSADLVVYPCKHIGWSRIL